jgi:hypothetical protein
MGACARVSRKENVSDHWLAYSIEEFSGGIVIYPSGSIRDSISRVNTKKLRRVGDCIGQPSRIPSSLETPQPYCGNKSPNKVPEPEHKWQAQRQSFEAANWVSNCSLKRNLTRASHSIHSLQHEPPVGLAPPGRCFRRIMKSQHWILPEAARRDDYHVVQRFHEATTIPELR